ncbi:hypothetical protein FH609_025835 [Streptomyces sp. 3MP-14]|uniref:Uncharacterized protein n=1 Tax=Streptomyces mimosae TaxID=2586635 RepID=A0A5N6A214_9ACTN|nr:MULTISPECIES: hypothetical protein [Streptomyces]KAB8162029.1 hypothetical protein FH607_023485 [Streptomyces mimosae]KAB8173727.1 hypothetical protein FH609_025835 [Streptomyces sp. 3MP-14]
MDSSFKGTVQELLTAAYPRTNFEGRYAFFGAAPEDTRSQKKHGYVVHLSAEQTAEGRGFPFEDLQSDRVLTFASKEPINAIEDSLHGPLDTPLRLESSGPVQIPQRDDPIYLRGFNPALVPERFRDPLTREAIKAAALLAVHDSAMAVDQTRPDWITVLAAQQNRFITEVRN